MMPDEVWAAKYTPHSMQELFVYYLWALQLP